MWKHVIRFAVALLTFIWGIILASVFERPTARTGNKPAQLVNVLIEPKTPELRPKELEAKAKRHSDLSIILAVSEPNPNPPSLIRRDIKLAMDGPRLSISTLLKVLTTRK